MALASLFPTTLARLLCWLGFARLSSLAVCAGRAGGFFFSPLQVLCVHGKNFCLRMPLNATQLF
jgi:hypothetical protein